MECDCHVSSPSQRVELRDVTARLKRLTIVRAQHTLSIGEEALSHQECFLGATAPTDRPEQIPAGDEGLRIIGPQTIMAVTDHPAKYGLSL
jgi:hypothetical protein